MSVKFRIGFEVDAQTMWGIMAKFLPFENLNVEEIVERPKPVALPKLVKLNGAKRTTKRRLPGNAVNLAEGVNGVIMAALADGQPHRYKDLKRIVADAGYAATGIGSRISRLHGVGALVHAGPGLWRAAPKNAEP